MPRDIGRRDDCQEEKAQDRRPGVATRQLHQPCDHGYGYIACLNRNSVGAICWRRQSDGRYAPHDAMENALQPFHLTLRPSPPLACKLTPRRRPTFVPARHHVAVIPPKVLKTLLHPVLRTIRGRLRNKDVECGSSRQKPHRTSGNIYSEGFQARPEPLDGLVNGADLDGVGPGASASPDAERRRRKNPNLL